MANPSHQLVIGLDVGTAGVRAVAVNERGSVVARKGSALEPVQSRAEGWHEQDPESWWQATLEALGSLSQELAGHEHRDDEIVALCVDGTSGTLVCTGSRGEVLRPAIMHNDQRAREEAQALYSSAASTSNKLGFRMAPSFAAAKILWLQRHEPGTFAATRWFAHQADFISARLCAEYGVTDYSNALKTGFDLVDERWPTWWRDFDGVEERLPRVVPPGTQIGVLDATLADSLGFPVAAVVSGATDGTAAFLASGAREAGADHTTLGTTLVFKRLSRQLAADEDGLVYSHKLPGGFWLPGAASNTGGEWIQRHYGKADLGTLDRQSLERFLPCDHVAYPLVTVGERFPFLAADARGFCHPGTSDPVARYAANLQGTAFVERLGYEVLDHATNTAGGDIYATGGASRSDIWLQLRADVTGRCIHRPDCAESAFGSAVMAASVAWHDDVWSAAQDMVHIERSFEPDRSRFQEYEDRFQQFRASMEERGYLQPQDGANR